VLAWCCRRIAGRAYAVAAIIRAGRARAQARPQEPWTPYACSTRSCRPRAKAGPSRLSGLGDIGAAVLKECPRSLIFGGTATVEQYKATPRPGPRSRIRKFILGDDRSISGKYIDIMADSITSTRPRLHQLLGRGRAGTPRSRRGDRREIGPIQLCRRRSQVRSRSVHRANQADGVNNDLRLL